MDEHDWLAERFEENRTHLRAVAYRMLGSPIEADDAVQESWLRLSRARRSQHWLMERRDSCGRPADNRWSYSSFTIIVEIDMIADRERIPELDVAISSE
jgi:Sigma-70 region 2